jgi:hypothetical protein
MAPSMLRLLFAAAAAPALLAGESSGVGQSVKSAGTYTISTSGVGEGRRSGGEQ